jgi:hypothetical protein
LDDSPLDERQDKTPLSPGTEFGRSVIMKKWSIFLGICLVAQIALAVGANMARTDYGAFQPMEALLSFDKQMIDQISIDEDGKQQVTLNKKEGNWLVSQVDDFQADQNKVNNFLEKLSDLKKGWPVATTAPAAKRFKVAKDAYERKITLSKNGKSNDLLFIGTSPSFRKVHARAGGENNVFAVDFADYDASAKPEDWIDKDVLKHPVSEISRVELPDVSLTNQNGKPAVEGITDQEETVADEADNLLRKIADLRISKVLGTGEKAEYGLDKPVLQYTLKLSSGETEKYVFAKPKEADNYVLKPSQHKAYFQVAKWVVDGIKAFNRSKLVKMKTEKAEKKAEKDVKKEKVHP